MTASCMLHKIVYLASQHHCVPPFSVVVAHRLGASQSGWTARLSAVFPVGKRPEFSMEKIPRFGPIMHTATLPNQQTSLF